MTQRVGIYARFSDKLQNPASIEDQIRLCREKAQSEGWVEFKVYTDAAISGFTVIQRPGVKSLIEDAKNGKFDIILAEGLDRISRDQADAATLHKHLTFAGVQIVTLHEGVVTPMHIGFKGTMNALYLVDLKSKVKRGQRGRVESGKIGGGNCYGYRVARRIADDNSIVNGERQIDPAEAKVIQRIFREYADGKSPRAIASGLNRDGIPGPVGKKNGEGKWRPGEWQQSTIYGQWQRGSGILNNELYQGWIVWNKVSYPKNPETGKHVARVNPQSEWIRHEVPELRIIDEEIWLAVKARQKRTRSSVKKFWQHQRPIHLFSGLIKCGCCGGGMAKISTHQYGCSTARNKGDSVCSNRRNIRQDELEGTVLQVLQSKLMEPALIDEFCTEYTSHINRLRRERSARAKGARAEVDRLKARATQIVRAAIDGFGSEALKEELKSVEAKQKEIEALLQQEPETSVRLHPNLASRYRREVKGLVRLLHEGGEQSDVRGIIRGLIDRIELTPDPATDGMLVSLYGELAGIMNLASGTTEATGSEDELNQIRLVAGLMKSANTRRTGQRARNRRSFSGGHAGVGSKLVGPAGLEPATRPL